MSLPPRNSNNRPPKRQRFPPPVPEEEEEEEDEEYSAESLSDDEDEEDYSDESADDEDDEEEGGIQIAIDLGGAVREAQSRGGSPDASSSQLSVKLKSSELLDCPTCLDPLMGPIYQCTNGHLTCSSCLGKVRNQCPFCRMPIGEIRCRAMERLIESSLVPCCNAIYGCRETSPYGNQSRHEKACAYVPCFCPLPDCNYTGAYKNLQAHTRASHSWDVENLTPFVFDTPQMFNMNLAKKMTAVFQEKKEGDLIVVQAFKGTQGGVLVTVSSIVPSISGLRDLSCSIAKLNGYTTLKLGLMVKKIQNVREQEEPKDAFMFIPDYMLSDDQCKMQICVGRKYKYAHI
ncbi:hypothetical protein N665_2591s0001 [Sinapis alba]|nr:hypothetical protein N665_2591s0001 [Sinapis alba]